MSAAYENQALILNRLNLSLPEIDLILKKNKNVTFFFSLSLIREYFTDVKMIQLSVTYAFVHKLVTLVKVSQ